VHRIRVFIAGVFSVLAAMALVGLAAPGLAAAAGPQTSYGQAKIINTDRIVGFPQGSMLSRPASQDGPGAPVITPASETVAQGGTASFSASGSGFFFVYWSYSTNGGSSWANLSNGTQSDGSTVTGATTATLGITNAQADENNNKYEANFVGFSSITTTNPATLTVTSTATSAPVITLQPVSQTVASGAPAAFSAAASGSPTPTVEWWYSTNGGTTWTAIPSATSTTYSFTASSSESGYKYEAVFTNSAAPGGVTTNSATLTVTAAPTTVQSYNWSGYADSGATFSAVSASWIVPTVTCTQGENAYSAHWIGIDGYPSSTVEQDGTEADCLTSTSYTTWNGWVIGSTSVTSASYDAWYELYAPPGVSPVNNGYEVELSPSTYPVHPGDAMSAKVSVSGTTWTFSIWDTSRWAAAFTTSIAFSGAAQSSAEWVAERPELCSNTCSTASLADFGSVTFSNATATTTGGSSEPISSYSDTAIEMVNNNGSTVLAVPGPLNGEGFTDTWKAIGP